eukprot:365743-Chlamydomonas_euryale.AAC.25
MTNLHCGAARAAAVANSCLLGRERGRPAAIHGARRCPQRAALAVCGAIRAPTANADRRRRQLTPNARAAACEPECRLGMELR